MNIISLDTGNKNIKTLNHVFVSGVSESQTEPSMSAKTEWLKYNGKYYVLSGHRLFYQRDKSTSDRYFILALMGIVRDLETAESQGKVKYSKDEVYNIRLLTGLPPGHMEDGALKKRYRKYFRTEKPVQVLYNGRTWNIDIKNVMVYAQCFAALMSKPEILLEHKKVLGIDMGGMTSDYMELVDGIIVPDHTSSLENGLIPLYRKINTTCQNRFDEIIGEVDVDEILMGKSCDYNPAIVKYVREEAEAHTETFLSSFREVGISLKNEYVVFIGGCAILLWEFIKKSPLLNGCMLLPDVKANAIGYDMLYRATGKGKK